MANQDWKVEFAALSTSGGTSCKLKSASYTLVLEGMRANQDGPVWIHASLYRNGGTSGELVGQSCVLENSALEVFLRRIVHEEMDKAYHGHLEQLFRFEATRRMSIFLQGRSLSYQQEREKVLEIEKAYPSY